MGYSPGSLFGPGRGAWELWLLLRERWDSAAVASRLAAQVLVVRAGRDSVVRPARTDRLLEVLPRETLVVDLPEAEHATLQEDPGYWPPIEDFLR